jgi:hypothetical protein
MKTIDTLIVYYYDGMYYYSCNGYETHMYYQGYYLYPGLSEMAILLTGIFLGLLLVLRLKKKRPVV